MEKSKKIKMVTFTPHPNFGTSLQSYALNYILKDMGHDVEFIYNNNDFLKRGAIGTIKDVIKKAIPQSMVEGYWRWKRVRRSRALPPTDLSQKEHTEAHIPPIIKDLPDSKIAFVLSKVPFFPWIVKLFKYRTTQWKKVYKFTYDDGNYKMRRIYTTKQYEEVVDDADLFITGSDQIWNPYCCGFNPFMFLEFVKGRKKCISYSSSISRPSFPPEVEDRVKKDLEKFEHIAVREQKSVQLLKQLLNRDDIKLVVDPTYLLPQEIWRTFGERAKIEFTLPERYIFCYFIGNRHNDYFEMVETVKKETGIKDVITIDCTQGKNNYGDGILYKDGGPYEFIYLLSHASFICMDSFHATIFAIKFRINFAHILKTADDISENSQNERMRDLFSRYNITYKLYNKGTDSWKKDINWEYIERISEEEITSSLSYLETAICE